MILNTKDKNANLQKIVDELAETGSNFEFKRGIDMSKLGKQEKQYLKELALAILCNGFSTLEVAQMLNLPLRTVESWRLNSEIDVQAEIRRSAMDMVGSRVANCLNTVLSSIERIAILTSQETYIHKHSPEKVAVVFDLVSNFAMKIMESKQRADMAKRELELRELELDLARNGNNRLEVNSDRKENEESK